MRRGAHCTEPGVSALFHGLALASWNIHAIYVINSNRHTLKGICSANRIKDCYLASFAFLDSSAAISQGK